MRDHQIQPAFWRAQFCASVLILLFCGLLPHESFGVSLEDKTSSELEKQERAFSLELETLAQFRFRSGAGAVGYRSENYTEPQQKAWIQVNLQEPKLVDKVVIIPEITRDKTNGFRAIGFPLKYQLSGRSAIDGELQRLALVEESAEQAFGIQPRVINLEPTMIASLRMETSELTARSFDGGYHFGIAEIMLFSGDENVALRQEITVSKSNPSYTGNQQRQPRFAVDGFMPYLMDGAGSNSSIAAFSYSDADKLNTITIDLGGIYTIDHVYIHTVEQSDTVPQGFIGNVGTPNKLRVEGSQTEDFLSPKVLLEDDFHSVYECGPIIMRSTPATKCRYVKLIALEPYLSERAGTLQALIGFAEIELFEKGKNVALHKTTTANFEILNPIRSLSTLTDGLNYYGEILPTREWMRQLARRSVIEQSLSELEIALKDRYAQQKRNLIVVSWLSTFLVFFIIIIILVYRVIHLRQIASMKERFAADLHDELGANIHAIGLLSDLAKSFAHSPTQVCETADEIRATTQRTGQAIRHCTEMQQGLLPSDPINEMRRVAKSILIGIDYTFDIEGEDTLGALPPRRAADFYLFFKESLVNISRHADATQCTIKLTFAPNQIELSIQDNGCGLSSSFSNGLPKSLERRAKLLKARVQVKSEQSKGTHILAKIRPPKSTSSHA